jgi:hypothetical protein
MDPRDARLRQLQARKDREATEAARAAAGVTDIALNASSLQRRGQQQQQQRQRHRDSTDDGGLRKFAADGVFTQAYHAVYKASPWVIVTGLPTTISEGDLAAVAAQYGRIVDVRLDRSWHRVAEDPNKPRRFADGSFVGGRGFVAFEDPRSCVLATDNLQGIELAAKNPALMPHDAAAPPGGSSRPPQKLRWDHCHEAQVPALPADVPTYAEWLHAQAGFEGRRVAEAMRKRRGVSEAKLALAVGASDMEV